MNYLLDTCVVSELVARQPNLRVVQWIDSVDDQRLYLSVITIGEIRKGIVKLPSSPHKVRLETWLDERLLVRFGGRIVPIGIEVMLKWGELTGGLEASGKTLPAIDSLLAATALHSGFALVTRNEEDFRGTGVSMFNPWRQGVRMDADSLAPNEEEVR